MRLLTGGSLACPVVALAEVDSNPARAANSTTSYGHRVFFKNWFAYFLPIAQHDFDQEMRFRRNSVLVD